jgi:hypothetical protein
MSVRNNLEGNSNLLHFCCNSIGPEGVAILAVKIKCLFNRLRHFYANLVGPFEMADFPFSNKEYDPVALFQNMWNPPVKGWLMVYAEGHGILSGL